MTDPSILVHKGEVVAWHFWDPYICEAKASPPNYAFPVQALRVLDNASLDSQAIPFRHRFGLNVRFRNA